MKTLAKPVPHAENSQLQNLLVAFVKHRHSQHHTEKADKSCKTLWDSGNFVASSLWMSPVWRTRIQRIVISPAELSRLWREHAAALELLARTRCGSPEDCVQEAFIRLASQIPVPDDPLAWLARVVRNQAISQARASQRRLRREQRVASWQAAWLEPADVDQAALSSAEVDAALRELDEVVREVLVAHIWGGLTFRQIAEAFEMPRSTVHRRYLSALEQLRGRLGMPLSDRDT